MFDRYSQSEESVETSGGTAIAAWPSLVAHELRQPLGAILVSIGNLERLADPSARTTTSRIRRAAQRLDRMVADLTDEAAIRAGALAVAGEDVRLGAVVVEALCEAEHITAENPVELHAPPELPGVHADPSRLHQVVHNLLSNAVKYGEAGEPIIVRLEARGAEIITSVTNRGPGISEEERLQLFEPGYRTASARGARVGGLGLGLFIARALVEAQGGRMGVDCSHGETAFWFAMAASGSRTRTRG